ncbi:MAG TPA: VWA domain-containing protein, partial [Burkholderiales bacterium]
MIELAYPAALAALLAIPLLLLLYLLRPRRRRVVLSTIALWQAALRDREGAQGLRKLPRNLSLLLLLATALLLGFALAGPQWLTRSDEGTDTVLVLDVSASMKTRSGAGTRFDQALSEALAIADRLPRNGRMLVMTSGRKAVLRSGFEPDRAALRRVLQGLQASDEAGRPREALALALSLLGARERGRVYFLTDGAFDPEEDPRSPQIEFRIVGTPARNIAITRFDLRQERADDEHFQVLLTLRNYTDAPAAVPASARLDGRALFERTVQLEPKSEQTLVLAFPGQAVGQAEARIAVEDALEADNVAVAALNAPPTLRVLLFSPGNFYLKSVLEALPGVSLSEHAAA